MKSTLKLILLAFVIIFFTSCEKSYQCQCTINGTSSVQEVTAKSYSEAVAECEGKTNSNVNNCQIIDDYVFY